MAREKMFSVISYRIDPKEVVKEMKGQRPLNSSKADG